MIARAHMYVLIMVGVLGLAEINAQSRTDSNDAVLEGALGLFFGDAFGGGTANGALIFEQPEMRYTIRYVYQVDSRAIEIHAPPRSRVDRMREASFLVGLVYREGPGLYSGSVGIGWTWGTYYSPRAWGRFNVASLCLETYGGVEILRVARIGLLARANINRIRSTGSINASIGIVLL